MTRKQLDFGYAFVIGMVVGWTICGAAHAGPPCTPPNPEMACMVIEDTEQSGSFWDAAVMQREDQARRTGETLCESTMAEAMRAMTPYLRPFVDPAERRRYANAPTITDDLLCRSPWCYSAPLPDTRSLAEKLRDTQREYERNQERLGRQIVEDEQERWVYRQWESAKACWATGFR